jgi:4a-hydroxytetrahydrobiopterin dehydratase
VSFSTHSAKGLTSNDFICAAQVSALPEAEAAQ